MSSLGLVKKSYRRQRKVDANPGSMGRLPRTPHPRHLALVEPPFSPPHRLRLTHPLPPQREPRSPGPGRQTAFPSFQDSLDTPRWCPPVAAGGQAGRGRGSWCLSALPGTRGHVRFAETTIWRLDQRSRPRDMPAAPPGGEKGTPATVSLVRSLFPCRFTRRA